MFALTWECATGGSCVRYTRGDVLEMDVEERDWLLERIAEQRDAEAKKLRAASR